MNDPTSARSGPAGCRTLACLLAVAVLAARGAAAAPETSPIRLQDVTAQTGIAFRHTDGSSGRRYIVETVTAGLATFDYNSNGLADIYFLNGAPLPGTPADPNAPPQNALYRNNGDFTFTDVTAEAGVGDTGFGLGVAVADYNNDGFPDIFVNNFGRNVLYRNNGDGTFTEATLAAGVDGGELVGAGACFLDVDGNGSLDLYVGNYVDFTFDNHVEVIVRGIPQYSGPMDYDPVPDILYRNNGDGTFTDVTYESGIAAYSGMGMGIIALDFDNDGHTDIAVLNDFHGDYFFRNDGTGRFEEVGLATGFAYDANGQPQASMGVDAADYDNDGWIDLYHTAYAGALPALYRNVEGLFFEDVTRESGVAAGTFPWVNWGTGFADFDNDGLRDLYVAHGHLHDNVHLFNPATAYEVRNQVFWNVGGGQFVDVSASCGDGLDAELSSRGVALDDLDNTGKVDVVVLNSRREPTVLRNTTATGHRWLQVELRGVTSNRDGVGSHVRVVAGDLTQLAEVHSGRGYQGHFGSRLHFGLGDRDRVDRIEVRWHGADWELFRDVPVDRCLTLTQGTGESPSQ